MKHFNIGPCGRDETEVFNVDCHDDLGQDSFSFRAVVVFMKTAHLCCCGVTFWSVLLLWLTVSHRIGKAGIVLNWPQTHSL